MKTIFSLIMLFVISELLLAQTTDTSLVAYYPFNGNAIDLSGFGNNGTPINGVSFDNDRWNNPNQAIRFNKSLSQYVDVQNSPSLQIDSAISFSFWTKRNILDNGQDQVLNKGGDWPGGTCNYGLVFSEWTLVFIYNGGYYIVNSPGVPLDNEWHHYAVTALEGTTEIHFYVDGVERTSMFGGGNPVINLYAESTSDLYISGVNYYSNNTMDELKIYKRILSEIEIKSLYSDLVAYFPFNGNTIDASGNGYDGTINGNAALVPDRFNSSDKAFTFPDQSSSISLANSTNLNLENGFTINAWIKYTVNNYTTVIVCKHVCGFVNGFFFGIDTDGQIQLWIGNSVWSTVRTNQSFVEGQWYMVTATYDASTSTAKVFVDGEVGGSGSVIYNNFSSNPISIGESYLNNCGPGFMDGAVDEVKIYNRSLSDTEILEEYNNTYSDLVLFLPFNGNASDESGNNNNGTVSGASLTQDRFGVNGQAYSFDGIDDFISISDNPNLFSDELTISWWYKLTETPGPAAVVIGYVDGTHGYQQFFNGEMFGYLNGYNPSAPALYFNPIYNLNYLNVWKHIAVTYKKLSENSSTTSIYVDGELKQTDNHDLAMVYAPGTDFSIGRNISGAFFKGLLDDFRIFNRNLNAAEIFALYQDTSTYFPDSLIAYFPFNGNANDEGPLHNNGTPINTLLVKDRYSHSDSAYYFNGTDSRIQVPQTSFYNFGINDFTLSSWINASEIGTVRIISAGYQENDNIWGFGFGSHPVWGTGKRINYFVYSGNAYQDFSSDEIFDYSPGEWIFVSATKSGNQIKFYTNGLPVGSASITYPSNANSYLSIGCRQLDSNNLIEFFNGKIDEVKIFNKSFTDEQIWNMYKATTTAPNLLSPGNDSTLINPYPIIYLDWDSTITANEYRLLISSDPSFNNVVKDTLTNTSSFDLYYEFFIYHDNLYWKVRTINDGGIGPWSEVNHFSFIYTDVAEEKQIPTKFALMQNYPNPFNPSTTITYHLPKASNVELKVYDIIGNEIATLVNEYKSAGVYKISFSINYDAGLSSGIYFYKITAGEFVQTRKMIMIK